MNGLLEAKGVSFSYERGSPVLEDVDAVVREGALVGIVGPNGSGKSTLLRLLCGLLSPGAGAVLLNERPLRSFGGRARARQLAFLPQSITPAFSLSVFEVVCLGRYPHTNGLGGLGPADLAAAENALRETHCEALRHRDFSSLSGGERQRVLLASILAQEPRILLLDEPTSALDIHHQVEVLSLLHALSGRGYGMALVTHDLNLAARFCHEIVLLGHDHRIAACGPPSKVLTETLLSAAYDAPIRVAPHPFLPVPLIMAAAPGEPAA